MSSSTKIIVLTLLLLFIGAVVATSFIPWQEEDLRFTEHTVNTGELTEGVLVGQTFVARRNNLSGIAAKFATYSNRANVGVIEFHLRESIESTTDLRVASVAAEQLRDNQLHRFAFEPIPDSARKTYFWYVTAPDGQKGQSVTVDLDTRDPYHEGSAYVVRTDTPASLSGAIWQRSGKQTADVVFGTYHATSLRATTINSFQQFVRRVIGTWDQRQNTYLVWLELFAPVLAFSLLLLSLRGSEENPADLSTRKVALLLTLLVGGAILLRLLYGTNLPLTNDEGNYLYDARSLLRGVLAGGDGYVKAPLVVGWAALWQFLLGNTIMAGRMSMMLVSALLVIPIYSVGKQAWGQRAGLVSAAAWAFMGAPVAFGIYLHTQSLALLFGVAGLAVLWTGLRQDEPRSRWFIAAGLLLGLGVASRKSILALGLVPLLLILLESRSWSERIRRLLMVGVSFGAVLGLFVAGAIAVYGCDNPLFLIRSGERCMAVEEALGINSAEDGLTAVTPDEAEQVRTYSLRGMTPFFRESLPLIILSLIGWGVVLETVLRRGLQRWLSTLVSTWRVIVIDYVLSKLVWLLPGAVFWWAWSFFWEYEGASFHELGGMGVLWYAMGIVLLVVGLWPSSGSGSGRRAAPTNKPVRGQSLNSIAGISRPPVKKALEWDRGLSSLVVAALLPAVWIGGLVFFYMNWIKFHANYIVEFLPPLAIMGGIGAYLGWLRLRGRPAFEVEHPGWGAGQRIVATAFLVVVAWAFYLSNYVTYMYEHTGTFALSSVEEAAVWAQQHIPLDEPLFTGAAAVPYVSGHRVALDIAHPRWYAYEFTRKDVERLTTFLPPAEEMLEAYRDAQWLLLEQQTGFSFLMEYSEIEQGLLRDWQLVHEVENLSNPLKFYRRVR